MKPWKLGYSIWWDLEGPLPDAAFLASIREAGVDCVETGVRGSYDPRRFMAYVERLREVIDAYQQGGVAVWSVHIPFGRQIDVSCEATRETGLTLARAFMGVCEEKGVGRAVLHPSAEPIRPEERQARLANCVASVNTLCGGKVALAVENLPRTCLLSVVPELEALLRETDARVCVDVNHYHKGDIRDMIAAASGRIETVHISDDDGLDEKHFLPGEGVLKWPDVMRALWEAGYRGAFLYELRGEEPRHTPAEVRENYDRLVKACGLFD